MKRTSGVLLPVSSLWGSYSCGSFGFEAREFIDFLSDSGFSWWQILPFGMTDEFNSPYISYSAFGGNPYFIDLPTLNKKGLITDDELKKSKQKTSNMCEYDVLRKERVSLLKKAAARAAETSIKSEVQNYAKEHRHIAEFCEFMALKEANFNRCWIDWTNFCADEKEIFAWQFIQYEFFMEWHELKSYANSKGIKILGDIPFYVSYDSADVWANKEFFQLNEDSLPKAVSGVPPDSFSEDGQLWGTPLYDWDSLKNAGYRLWLDRIYESLDIFDGIRLDHFRAFESYWSVDAKDTTARCGTWCKGPGMDFIKEIKKINKDKLILAEDLGMIGPEVAKLLKESGFAGMRVMQFAFCDDSDSIHLPHNYIENSVAYTGTHDNNTLLGYINEADKESVKRIIRYCACKEETPESICQSAVRTLLSSSAGMAVLPLQDILSLGSHARINTPGKAEGNWLYRTDAQSIRNFDTDKIRRLNEIYKRI